VNLQKVHTLLVRSFGGNKVNEERRKQKQQSIKKDRYIPTQHLQYKMIRPLFSISATSRIARISRPTLKPYRSFSTSDQPFYGSPRPLKSNQQRWPHQKLALAIHHAITAFSDPTRADAVAALGELTGQVSLTRIHQNMMADPTGQRILQDRPVVSKATIPYEQLMQNIPDNPDDLLTFGQAYGKFLQSHGFDPDERDAVKYIEDETLAYVMLRYRQVRSFFSC
jgi:hypothetical protein